VSSLKYCGCRVYACVLLLMVFSSPVLAQDISISLGEGGSLSGTSVQLLLLVTVLSLVPGLAIMITCFPFIVTVLSILRQAIGLQQSPPNMLIVTLALFLTYFVMDAVFQEAWTMGIQPLIDEQISTEEAFLNTIAPFRIFMGSRIDSETFESLRVLREASFDTSSDISQAPLSLLIPSFLLSEIERAFQIGFLIFLPFLIIDLVVAAVLMSMGMMMVPPAIVSLPFKLAFFVVADGWSLISGALVRSYF
jgi:flagellar biosynthetic protein FliP